jgi:hypothetical protein
MNAISEFEIIDQGATSAGKVSIWRELKDAIFAAIESANKPALPPIDDVLKKVLPYMGHLETCEMTDWADSTDSFFTSFHVAIEGPKCSCGMRKLALRLEAVYYGNAAIPWQHRKELLGEKNL